VTPLRPVLCGVTNRNPSSIAVLRDQFPDMRFLTFVGLILASVLAYFS
jgi:hypothetical protein